MNFKKIVLEVVDFVLKMASFCAVFWLVCWPGRKIYLSYFSSPSIGEEVFFPLAAILVWFFGGVTILLLRHKWGSGRTLF